LKNKKENVIEGFFWGQQREDNEKTLSVSGKDRWKDGELEHKDQSADELVSVPLQN